MLDLDEFRQRMTLVARYRQQAREFEQSAHKLEEATLKAAGITWVSREAGFPCWEIEGLDQYFNSPEEAMRARAKKINYASPS